MSFLGEHHHTLDSKGRLIVPARMRDELGDQEVVLTKWFNGSVALWSQETWAKEEANLLQLGRSNPDARAVVRFIGASAHQDRLDRQGRIMLPANLRTHAGIERNVVIAGVIDHGEIWSPENFHAEQEKGREGGLEEWVRGLGL